MAVIFLLLPLLSLCDNIISFGSTGDFYKHLTANIHADENTIMQHNIAIRRRRGTSVTALLLKGNEAVKKILKGAVQLPSDDRSTLMFQKTGNLKTALNDFKSTKPVPVSDGHTRFPFGPKIYYMNDRVYGQAGDRILRLDKHSRVTGKPTMTIMQKIDSSHYRVYKVIYTQ